MTPPRPPLQQSSAPGHNSAGAVALHPDRARRVASLRRLSRALTWALLPAGLGALGAVWFHPPAIVALVGLCALLGGGRLLLENGVVTLIMQVVVLHSPSGPIAFEGAAARLIGGIFVFAGIGTAAFGLFLASVGLLALVAPLAP